jgi:hypothetical protein
VPAGGKLCGIDPIWPELPAPARSRGHPDDLRVKPDQRQGKAEGGVPLHVFRSARGSGTGRSGRETQTGNLCGETRDGGKRGKKPVTRNRKTGDGKTKKTGDKKPTEKAGDRKSR